MYKIGDHVIYGRTGICVVKDIGYRELPGMRGSRLYYTLKPVYTTEIIYTPVDTAIFIRQALTRGEAVGLIRQIPVIENTMEDTADICGKELMNYYKSLISSHDCKDLVRLIITIYSKTQQALQNKRIIGQTDRNFMRHAEDILYGELSVALGIDKNSVPAFIEHVIEEKKGGKIMKKEVPKYEFVTKANHA